MAIPLRPKNASLQSGFASLSPACQKLSNTEEVILFEFSVARKYLIPRRKQLSASLIGVLSVGVISLVVWLLLVFLSVMDGIEKKWLERMTVLHAPLRINPTPSYFASYYYQIDQFSAASGFAHKTIGEKKEVALFDPYSQEEDSELPPHFPLKDDKDPVKSAFTILQTMQAKRKDLAFQDYEMSGALLRLELVRPAGHSSLTQVAYMTSFPDQNPSIHELLLPSHKKVKSKEKPVFLPKSFQDNGVLVGDTGYVSYTAQSASALQEQRFGVCVAGFYDPGIMAVGNRCILAPKEIVRAVHAAQGAYTLEKSLANGIQVWFKNLQEAPLIKQELTQAFEKAGIADYWKISTFREYDFAKDLLQQFQSDKYLFTLVGIIVLIVACCNIISLLVLLVNDKKHEIGTLQAMGAGRGSIACIFAFSGGILGILGCLIGTGAALLTLHNIDALVNLLSFLQGHEAFNALFYGKTLPKHLSSYAVVFVCVATPILSLVAGLVPALKACRMKPSEILRSQR